MSKTLKIQLNQSIFRLEEWLYDNHHNMKPQATSGCKLFKQRIAPIPDVG
jgi:hypothetical protein